MAASTDERNRILHLVEAGKVTAEEAARLLDTLDSRQDPTDERKRKRTVRVRVTNLATNRQKATVTIPVSLIEVGLRLGTRLVPQIRGSALEDQPRPQAHDADAGMGRLERVEDALDRRLVARVERAGDPGGRPRLVDGAVLGPRRVRADRGRVDQRRDPGARDTPPVAEQSAAL